MNIKDFLMDNYIWILAIILITIVTIIGFLADKKKGGKKKENVAPPQQPMNNNQRPMQYQPELQNKINQQPNMMPNNLNAMGNEIINQNASVNMMMNNQNMGTIPQPMTMETTNNIANSMNNPQPVENIVSNVEPEPMYQPLSEQIPKIAPQPVPNFGQMSNTTTNEMQSMNQNITSMDDNFNNSSPLQNNIPTQSTMMNTQPMMQDGQQFGTMPNYNVPSQMNMVENNNFQNLNMIPNQGTIPQPVNPIPMPQPVVPQPIMTNQMIQDGQQFGQMPNYNVQPPMQNNNSQNIMPQQNFSAGQPTPQNQQAVNFVYGAQNNNQNM